MEFNKKAPQKYYCRFQLFFNYKSVNGGVGKAKKRKICYLVKSSRKHIWNPQLIHMREVLRDKNGDCKAVILSALTKVKNKDTCD